MPSFWVSHIFSLYTEFARPLGEVSPLRGGDLLDRTNYFVFPVGNSKIIIYNSEAYPENFDAIAEKFSDVYARSQKSLITAARRGGETVPTGMVLPVLCTVSRYSFRYLPVNS